MFDVITFGSATQDIYLKSKKFRPVSAKSFVSGRGICLPLGSKIEIDGIAIFSGGGGTNAAATFKNQGFRVAYCGMVGQDCFGGLVVRELQERKIDTTFMRQTNAKSTNLSVFLTYPRADRTILVHRGASDLLSKKDIPWSKIKNAKWFYLAPFGGPLAGLTEHLVNFAKRNGIRVALNPGYNQLTLPRRTLARILKKVDVLILNREEAALLTKIPYRQEARVFQKIDQLCPGIAIMTKGADGVIVSDGRYLYRAASLGLKEIDRTGAGDAFSSGFVAGLMKKNDIVYAIQLAMANAGYNLTEFGAKDGLLLRGQPWRKAEVTKQPCAENNLCGRK